MLTALSPDGDPVRVRPRESDGPEPSRRLDAFALLGVGLLAAFFLLGDDAGARAEFPLDDAWIHLVYARNLWQDGYLTYNPGVAESGASSLLWVIALAPVQRAFALPALVLAVKLLSALAAGVTAAGVARIAAMLHPDRSVPWWAAAWVLLSPAYAFAALSGMEVTLASALLAWALVHDLRGRFALAGVLFGLSALARPECALVCVAIAALEWKRGPAVLLRLLLPPLLMAVAWIAINLAATGYPLPNTFYAKTQHTVWSHGLSYLARQVLLAHGAIYACLAAGLTGFGIAQVHKNPVAWKIGAAALPLIAIPLSHELDPRVGFYMQRYFLPFTPFDAPFVAVALCALRSRLPARLVHVPAIAAVLLVLPPLIAQRGFYLDHCRDIATLHTRPALEAIAPLPKGSLVAVEGAGASRFFGGHTILDLVGLNDHRLVHARGRGVRPCLVALLEPSAFVLPGEFLQQLAGDYSLEVYAQYHVPHWSVYAGAQPRTVLAAHARVKPQTLAACRQVLASAGVAIPH